MSANIKREALLQILPLRQGECPEGARGYDFSVQARPLARFCHWNEKARKDGIICAMQETINDETT